MKTATFNKITQIVYEKSGISLGPHKMALVQARVGKRLKALSLSDFESYLEYLTDKDNSDEIIYLLNSMSTNTTHFFREPQHFEKLEGLLKEWIMQGQKEFKIWSAACSSGEEPYSINAVCHYLQNQFSFKWKILATDISTKVLLKAKIGQYSVDKLNTIPKKYFGLVFSKKFLRGNTYFSVKPGLQQEIYFNRFNLCELPYPMKGPFDIIFFRNVMIYFDNPTRAKLLKEMARLLKPGGCLFVGHAESLTGQLVKMKAIFPSVYIKE